MPVNDFEKQVQQKMDELQLRPSAEVWEEVEKRIRKEKKRRWFILWFFIFGVLLLGGTSWWLVTGNKKQVADNIPVAQATSDKKNETKTINAKQEIIKTNETKIRNEVEKEKTTIQSATGSTVEKIDIGLDIKSQKTTAVTKIDKQTNKSASFVSYSEKGSRKSKKKIIPGNNNDKEVLIVQGNNKQDSTAIEDHLISTVKSSATNDSLLIGNSIIINDTISKTLATKVPMEDSAIVKTTEPVSNKDTSKAKKSKWEIGITGMVGTSGKSDGISIFGMEKSFDAASFNINTGTIGQTAIIAPSQPGNGLAWQIGGYAKRKLSVKAGLSVGLNLSVYSTTQVTGAFVDSSRVFSNSLYSSAVPNFYRSGTGNTYKNHYYYLQLPVSFHWQINKGKKLPLVFYNGFSAGVFTGNDALVYNSAANVFYRDSKSFYKMQFLYQSGVYVKLFNHSKNPLTTGLLFNYQLNKLQEVNVNGGNHLSSFGIQLGWLIKK